MTEDDSEKTRVIRQPKREQQARPPVEEETEMTRLIGPPRRVAKKGLTFPERQDKVTADVTDPVVGWLVIVAGPGRGNARQLGYGQNSVGREADERVSVNFGDETISRRQHCFVIYEPRQRQYLLRPGDGATLTYLDGKLVSQSSPLKAGDLIEIGETVLRFVPLCGEDFDWQERPEQPTLPPPAPHQS